MRKRPSAEEAAAAYEAQGEANRLKLHEVKDLVTMSLAQVERGLATGTASNQSDVPVYIVFDIGFMTADDESVGMNGKQIEVPPGETVEWQLFMHGRRSEGVNRDEVNSGVIVGSRIVLKSLRRKATVEGPVEAATEDVAPTETVTNVPTDYKLAAVLSATGCNGYQAHRVTMLASRLRSAPWGSAVVPDVADEECVLAFFDRLRVPDDFVAKSMIVGDHSGRMSRWEALSIPLMRDAEIAKTMTGLGEERLAVLTRRMESLVADRMVEAFTQMHGRPSAARFWRLPQQKRVLVGLSTIHGMTYTCVQGMTIWALSLSELAGNDNPYEPLLEVFERGVFVDWDNWRFTNMRLDDLGQLPQPPP